MIDIKKERSVKETEKLKREFQLGMNSYHVGSIESAELNKLNNHIFQGDGDYLIIKNRIGNFIVKMREAVRPGLPIEFNGNKIQMKVPKIPKNIYFQIVRFFKHIAKEMNNAEVFAQIYYDLEAKEYTVYIPEQEVGPTTVSYDAKKNLDNINRKRYVFVFEVHSHNTMPAFFSGTDNADEKETRFFGVIGEINKTNIAEKYRFMVMNKAIELKREDIFDFGEELETSFPKEWMDSVKQRTYSHGGYQKEYSYGPGYTGYTNSSLIYKNDYDTQYWSDYDERMYDRNGTDKDMPGTRYNTETNEAIDIYETFDITNYEDEVKPDLIEAFTMGLEKKDIPILLDDLVTHGFDIDIKEYYRIM